MSGVDTSNIRNGDLRLSRADQLRLRRCLDAMSFLKRCVLPGTMLLLTACGSDEPAGPSGPSVATVQFVYVAATEIDPAVAQQFPNCVQGVGQTHIHPGWANFGRFDMQVAGANRWERTFQNVPTDDEQRIRISDPNVCAQNPTGASTQGVMANGVTLTRIVDTPGSGIEPGLAFSVTSDGIVTP